MKGNRKFKSISAMLTLRRVKGIMAHESQERFANLSRQHMSVHTQHAALIGMFYADLFKN